ncbi:collagen alpha-1(XII) chain [Octopus sinensis]|uniref:Collagen alpha-1(XII) chain n=1 Tax=Octopus sinensis TaxID=2607531 RepID=A0A6P7U0U0_9MOLL|nr:collagen alpha-1(XII) chain [Octopus sinensis]
MYVCKHVFMYVCLYVRKPKSYFSFFPDKQVRDRFQNDPFKKACGGVPAEIVFIIDSSRSIYPPYFKEQIKFVGNFVKIFTIGPNAVQVGVVTYGDIIIPQNTFLWNKYQDEVSLVNAISNIGFDYNNGGTTQTAMGIRYAREEMFSKSKRRGIQKIAILITDGVSTDPPEAVQEAEALRKLGVMLIGVGVGDSASKPELVLLTGDSSRVFMVSGYDLLDTVKQKLELKACLPPTTTPPPTTPPPKEQPCEKDIDVNFVFDSGMLGDQGTANVVKFIESSISGKDLSRSNIRFGTVAGPCNKVYGFALNRYRTKEDIMRHFDQLHQTSLAPLLTDTKDKSFSFQSGGRPGARKVAVIFLKGKLNDPSGVAARASALRNSGVEVFVVNMDNMNSRQTLETIASPGNILDGDRGTSMVLLSRQFSDRLCRL